MFENKEEVIVISQYKALSFANPLSLIVDHLAKRDLDYFKISSIKEAKIFRATCIIPNDNGDCLCNQIVVVTGSTSLVREMPNYAVRAIIWQSEEKIGIAPKHVLTNQSFRCETFTLGHSSSSVMFAEDVDLIILHHKSC